MIPKKIHYCWLGGGRYPSKVKECIKSWRRILPDYELVLWDRKRFDVQSVPWVREAMKQKNYAFAADYIRHYALYTEGGIYLDSDVEVCKPFDELLSASRMFAAIEVNERVQAENIAAGMLDEEGHLLTGIPRANLGLGIQAAAFGSEAGHPFLRRCLDWYENNTYIKHDGKPYTQIIAPDIMAYEAIPFGFRYRDEEQQLAEDMRIYPSYCIAAWEERACEKSYAIHHCMGSWRGWAPKPRKRKRWYSRWWKGTMRWLGLHK